MRGDVFVVKADGERELFDVDKLEDSLKRAGAQEKARKAVVARVLGELADGMSTSTIYAHAFEHLRDMEDAPVAARYSVKRAVFDLGPSGFPFEQFFSALLKVEGWQTRTGLALTGRCAPHEVDVFATKGAVRAGIEVKFHNSIGTKTDLKDALYVHARFEDLKQAPSEQDRVTEGWLVTNTRFTRNVIRYARCAGLTLVGWDYPRDNGLMQRIERSGIHPLTCLTSLSDAEKRRLLDANIVLCSSVKSDRELLRQYGIKAERIEKVIDEASRLCTPVALDTPLPIGQHTVTV